jgi:hypothetical protein
MENWYSPHPLMVNLDSPSPLMRGINEEKEEI